jgi:hypothetical protein
MHRRTKVALGVGLVGAVALGVGVVYPLLRPVAGEGPDPREVEAVVERDYKHPARHTLTAAVENFDKQPHFVEWARRYDGIAMSTKVMSKRGPNGWETRWHRELAEPEPLRAGDLAVMRAVVNAGLGEALARGAVTPRLLYRAKFTVPPGSSDGELVVERYQLVIELEVEGRTTYVDAYTGEVVKRVPRAPT